MIMSWVENLYVFGTDYLQEEYMSQKKVDERKYLKKHRKEIERKKKTKTIVTCVVICLLLGAAIGVPTGINIYKKMPKFVGDATLSSFVANYIDENYSEEVDIVNAIAENQDEETTETNEYESAVEDALGEDVEVVDEDNIDEVLGSDEETETEEDSDTDAAVEDTTESDE